MQDVCKSGISLCQGHCASTVVMVAMQQKSTVNNHHGRQPFDKDKESCGNVVIITVPDVRCMLKFIVYGWRLGLCMLCCCCCCCVFVMCVVLWFIFIFVAYDDGLASVIKIKNN